MNARLQVAVLGITLVGAFACTARRVVAPPRPGLGGARVDLSGVDLYLREFSVQGMSEKDLDDRRKAAKRGVVAGTRTEHLQDALLDHLSSRARFHSTGFNLSGRRRTGPQSVELHVRIQLDEERHRTWLWDVLSVGVVPIVPSWGQVQIGVEAALGLPGAEPSLVYTQKVRAPYSALFYSWYRPKVVEAAWARGYEEAFRRLAEEMALDAGRIAALLSGAAPATAVAQNAEAAATPPPQEPAAAPEKTAADLMLAASANGVYEVPAELLPGEAKPEVVQLFDPGPHIILSEEAPLLDGTWYGYLRLLGGLEVSGILGAARVSSSVQDANDKSVEVASGTARQLGYRIALYSAPTSTGFFIYPVIGYLSQQISNVDMRSMLEEANPIDPHRGDIDAIATDPVTGESVDAASSNVYDLAMQSGYGGFRVGYDVVHGTSRFVFFISTSIGLNIAEYREVTATLRECGVEAERCTGSRKSWDFVRSGAAGATIGFKAPRAHIAVRLIFDYELYLSFLYKQPLEVRGPMTYNAAKDIYEYPRAMMNGAMLQTFTGQLAVAAVF